MAKPAKKKTIAVKKQASPAKPPSAVKSASVPKTRPATKAAAVKTPEKSTSAKASVKATPAKPAPIRATSPRKSSPAGGNGSASSALIAQLAHRLGEHRQEILHLYRHDLDVGLDAFRDGDDEIDRANFDSDRDLALSLSDNERETLLQIEEALRRIDTGAFGSCTSCSKPIGELRLNAIPWARYCIDCQELEEKGLLG
jgi:DnaK suppressor protein